MSWQAYMQDASPRCCTCMAVRIWNQIHGWRCVLRTMILIIIARMHICAFMCVYMFVSMYVPMYVCRCVCTPGASCLWAFQEPPGQLGFFGLYCGYSGIVGRQPTLQPAPLVAQPARHICNGEAVSRNRFLFPCLISQYTMTGNTPLLGRRVRTGATGRRWVSRCWAQDPEINVRKLTQLFCTTHHVCIYVCDAEHHSVLRGTRFGGRLQEGTLLFCLHLHIRHRH